MSQLGERLRQTREAKGLTLAQAAVETRIRLQSLQALEEGNFALLPNAVVTKGFIRNYAQFLDIPADELIDEYRMETGGSEPIQVVPATSIRSPRSYVLPSFFGVFVATVALVGLAYVILSATGYIRDQELLAARATVTPTIAAPTPTQLATSTSAPVTPTAEPTAAPEVAAVPDTPDAPETPDAPDAPTPAPTFTPVIVPTLNVAGATEPTPTPSATQEAPIVVEVSVVPGNNQGSWLRVRTDGTVAYEQIMQPGEVQVFLAQRQVDIRSGNPTFVQVSVNGLPPETLGQVPGEPVDWTWPPQ
jgi:cytoskeletal protein RodZ